MRKPGIALLVVFVFVVCDAGTRAHGAFGLRGTYVVAGGRRQLQLRDRTGTYTAVTVDGERVLPVTVGRKTISVGGLSSPYLAAGDLLIGGGYVAFAQTRVISDPKAVPGTYTTMTGVNFAGQLSLDKAGNYTWCMRSVISGPGACADGGAPGTGTTAVQSSGGFKFTGVPGTYAIYRSGSSAAIFPIDAHSLRLIALTKPSQSPEERRFTQTYRDVSGDAAIVRVSFSHGSLTVTGDPVFDGSYSYVSSGGILGISSPRCPNNVCKAIYSNELGILYIARLGTGIFLRR